MAKKGIIGKAGSAIGDAASGAAGGPGSAASVAKCR
jgi:hypothetical protein